MAKPKNVSVSIIPYQGEVFVWNVSFWLEREPPKTEEERRQLMKKIEQAMKNIDL